MKTARLAVLGVALAAGIGAAVLASTSKPPETAAPPPPTLTGGVLVAAKELSFGAAVDASELRWEDWPQDHIPEGLVRKSASPGGVAELQAPILPLASHYGGTAWSKIRIRAFSPRFCQRAAVRWRSISTRKVQARLVGLSCQTTEST